MVRLIYSITFFKENLKDCHVLHYQKFFLKEAKWSSFLPVFDNPSDRWILRRRGRTASGSPSRSNTPFLWILCQKASQFYKHDYLFFIFKTI